MSHRSSHGCQNSDIQKSSSSQTASQDQKLSCAGYNQNAKRWKTHRAKSSNDNHSNTANRAKKMQSGGYKLNATRSKLTKFRLRITQESPSKMTAFYSHGYHNMQHDKTRDSTSSKIQQQHTRRSDACLTEVKFYLSEMQSQANDQEYCVVDTIQHGLKVFGLDVTAKQMSI